MSTPPGWPDIFSLRPGPAGPDPPAPPPPEGATMSHRAPVWPLHAGIIGATAPRNRGPLPPVCPPPANYRRQPASTSPCRLQIPPAIRLPPPLPTSMDHRHPPTISRMCFPSGAACLKIPYGVEPRFSSTKFLCRLRATKTFSRSSASEQHRKEEFRSKGHSSDLKDGPDESRVSTPRWCCP